MTILSKIINLFPLPGGSDGKASIYNVRDLGSIPGWGRFPGEGNGNPLQSCLENPMDGGAWCRLLSMGSQSWARLSDFTSLHFRLTCHFSYLFPTFSFCLNFFF